MNCRQHTSRGEWTYAKCDTFPYVTKNGFSNFIFGVLNFTESQRPSIKVTKQVQEKFCFFYGNICNLGHFYKVARPQFVAWTFLKITACSTVIFRSRKKRVAPTRLWPSPHHMRSLCHVITDQKHNAPLPLLVFPKRMHFPLPSHLAVSWKITLLSLPPLSLKAVSIHHIHFSFNFLFYFAVLPCIKHFLFHQR